MTDYGMPNDKIYQKVVPYIWQMHIFKRIHSKECAHMSYDRVYPMIWQRFFWNNMSEDVLNWLKACKTCQQSKTGIGKTKMPLKTDFVGNPMDRVGMDLSGPYPESRRGNKYCLVVQDYFSKWIELFAIPTKEDYRGSAEVVR